MQYSRTINVKRNVIWGTLNKIINMLVPFITRTVLIYKLGIQYVGLSGLFGSILMVLSISELGFGNALVYHMYKPFAENNETEICKLLNFYRYVYRVIGIIILVLGVILLPFLRYLINGSYPEDVNIYILYLVYLINTVLSYFFFSYKRSLFIASQRVDFDSNINTVVSIIKNVVQLGVLIIFPNYYVYVLVIPITTILNNILIEIVSRKKYSKYRCVGNINDDVRRGIIKQVRGLFLQKIGNAVYEAVDTIVISAFLGLTVLGIYNNYYYILSSLVGVMAVLFSAIRPSVGNSIISESIEKNHADFQALNFGYVCLTGWIAISLFVLYQPFMFLWVGEDNSFGEHLVIFFALYFYSWKNCDMLAVYTEAAGLWYENRYTSLIAALVNLSINIISVKYIGLYGVLISSIVSFIFISDVGFGRTLYKYYFKNGLLGVKFALGQVFYLVYFAALAIICKIVTKNIAYNGIMGFIISGVLCLIIVSLVTFIFFRNTKRYKRLEQILIKR